MIGQMPRIHPEIRKRAQRLRHEQTPAEATLWARVRGRRLNGLKFYRQHPLGPFIADFYCPEHRLVVELDGGGHLMQQEYDQQRTEWLNSNNCRVIRFTNHQVRYEIDQVLLTILQACQGNADEQAQSDFGG